MWRLVNDDDSDDDDDDNAFAAFFGSMSVHTSRAFGHFGDKEARGGMTNQLYGCSRNTFGK